MNDDNANAPMPTTSLGAPGIMDWQIHMDIMCAKFEGNSKGQAL